MIILPAIAFLLFLLIFRKARFGWRRAFLAAATFSGASVVLITESLSVPRLVTRAGVGVSWLALGAVGLLVFLKLPRSVDDAALNPPIDAGAANDVLDRPTKLLLYATAIIATLVAITAILAPPSSIDVMAYHLPRVAMWINNHNVRFFPTGNYTQLIYGAFAEYSILHTMLLWGSDRFANMVQVFSFVGCAVSVSYVVKLLGGNRFSQALAAVVSITIPEGILEASGSMNTYSASFWIVTTAAFLLAWNRDPAWLNTVCLGLAAGLAIFTKGTTYIILPFIVLACWWLGSHSTRILFLKRSVVFLVLILAINAPQYLRNIEFDRSPLGVPLNYGEVQLTVQGIGVRSTLANILRNISFHAGTPSDAVNQKIEHSFRAAIHLIGVDPEDPRQMNWPGEKFGVNHTSFSELLAGNPLHLILLLLALALILAKFKQSENRAVLCYSVGLVSAFVAFSAMIKWHRWSSRFELPFFVLAAVIIAIALARYLPRKAVTAIVFLLVAGGLLDASMNRYRSLLPVGQWETAYGSRPIMYFAYNMDYLAPSYFAAADAINKTDCANVGIDTYTPLSDPEIKRSPDSFFTYPLFALIHADGRTRTAWFTGVHNLTGHYDQQQPHPAPCAVICLECANVPAKWEQYRSLPNHVVFENAVVFTSDGSVPR